MTPQEWTAHVQKLITYAIDQSNLTPEQVDALPLNGRFAQSDIVWEVRKPIPGLPGLITFAMFEGSSHDPLGDHLRGDVRIYCIPADPAARNLPYCRFLLSRANPSLLRKEYATQELFAEEIAAEWNDLAESLGVIDNDDEEDDESVECTACGFTSTSIHLDDEDDGEFVAPRFCSNCGASLTQPEQAPQPTPAQPAVLTDPTPGAPQLQNGGGES